jgi:hypothetical protein
MQAAKPAAQRGGIGHTMGIFDCRRRRFPGAAFHQTPVQRLHASRQTVVRVREGEGRKQGEGFPAVVTQTAAYLNPVMLFIVSLLTAPAMADDRVVFTERASSYEKPVASCGPGYQVVFPSGKWDNENRRQWGLCSGRDPSRSDRSGVPNLLEKNLTWKRIALSTAALGCATQRLAG